MHDPSTLVLNLTYAATLGLALLMFGGQIIDPTRQNALVERQ